MRIIRITAWAAVAVLIVAIGAVFYLRQNDMPLPLTAAAIGGPFSLTDQHGAAVTEASLKGHPSAIFFGYTFCPDVCPTTLYEMTTWLAELGADGDKLKAYFVTVDPERDNREQMASYLGAFDPRIVGLTGTRPEIDKMLQAYRVYSRKVDGDDGDNGNYLMDHAAVVYLLDADTRFTGTIDYEEKPETALAKLKRLVGAS